MNGHINRRIRIVIFLLLCLVNLTFAAPGHAAPDHADGLEIFTRDVFVIVGSTLRNPSDTTAPDAPLFGNSGINLGVTWGQWKGATATSTAHVQGGSNHPRTDVRLQLSGLIPGGVYSVFYVTLS